MYWFLNSSKIQSSFLNIFFSFSSRKVVIKAILLALTLSLCNFSAFSNDDNLVNETRCATFLIEKNGLQSLSDLNIDSIRANGMQAKCSSPSGKFLVHYDINNNGNHKYAVPPEDINNNGVPDYVDSVAYYFDYSHNFYLQIGYKSVYPDDTSGGTPAYDIYLIDLGQEGYYGFTKHEAEIPGKWKYPRNYSFIVIDNDFSPFDSLGVFPYKTQAYKKYIPIDFIKITSAHELHHAVQFLYGRAAEGLLYEMASTSMEVRIFPEITDYVQFLKNLFTNPNLYPFGKGNNDGIGYRYAIFGEYLYRNLGDEVQKRMWTKISQNMNPYLALDESLRESGSNLAAAWCGFLEWIYYTGSRSVPGKYFEYASVYPEIPFKPEYYFEPPSDIVEGSLYSFEFKVFRFYFPGSSNITGDTLDIIASNTDLSAAVNNWFEFENIKRFTFICKNTESAGYTRIGTTDYYYNMIYPPDTMCHKAFQRNGGLSVVRNIAFPNPFRPGKHDAVFIPVPGNASLFGTVELAILDASMNTVFSDRLPVVVQNGYMGVYWKEFPADISSGVYIYTVKSGESEIIGKFSVIR